MRQKNSITSPTKVEHSAGAAAMSRIVQCPKCRVLLQEPPPGNPYYQCGSCSTTLQAKHATKADLESTNIHSTTHQQQHVDKQNSKASTKADSSSEEISCERVEDDHSYGADGSPSWSPHRENGPVGPMYARIRAWPGSGHYQSPSDDTKAEMQHPDQGGRGFKTFVAANHHHQQPSHQVMNYDMEVDRTQQSAYVGGADYGPRRGAPAAAGERYTSPSPHQEASSYGSPGFNSNPSRPQAMPFPRTAATTNRANSGKGDVESEALRAHQPGANSVTHNHHHHQQHSGQSPPPSSEQQQVNSPSLKPAAAAAGTREPSSSTSTGATLTSSSSASSSGRTSKLKWQPRPETMEKQAVSSPRAVEVVMSSRGIVDDDRITSGLPHEDRGNETTTSVEYVPERNWRDLQSRRRGKHEDNRVRGDGQQQQHIQRTQFDGSEKNIDMYDSPSASAYGAGLGPDYETSETSSTMDDGEGNDGGANVGPLSPPPALHLPDLRGGIPKSLSRPNLPRSNASSGRLSSYSEDGSSHATKMLAEIDSMDNAHPQVDRVNRTNRRQHSWDATRTGAPSGTSSPVPDTETGLRKSSSDDYVNMISEPHEHVFHSRVSSDPTTTTTAGALYQQVDPQQQQQHHQWLARLKQQPQPPRTGANPAVSSPKGPPSAGVGSPRPPTHVQWDRSSSGSNLQTPYVEQNPLPSSQLNSFHPPPAGVVPQPPPSNQSSRPMPDSPSGPGGPGGQLTPKQVNYPPLPPPGTLPRVLCQHCRVLLAVPVGLPPPRKRTQKLRCGACMKISTFSVSVPQHPVEPSYTSSRSDVQYGQSLLASSPDAHESSSSNPGYRTTSGRSLSATSDELRRSGRRYSDLSDKSLPMTRNNSLGSADMPSDEELAERTRVMKIDSHSFSNPAISTTSEPPHPSSFSDGHSSSASEYKSRFSRGASHGPLYSKRGLSSSFDHGPGSGSSARQQTEERSRFAAEQRPSSRRQDEGITSSDSESEHHQTLSQGSPQIDSHGSQHGYSQSGSRTPSQHLHHHSPPMPASSSHGEHSGKDQAHHESHRGFFKGIINIKTSFRELTHRGQKDHTNQVRSKVSVNGVPIPDNVLKRAEEQAGKILPGSYWYDEHAGFWGVQGGQCEGIIPTFIEEFHYPMSRDCAGGRTGILVNGRELHSKDLEILAKRGLPNIPGRAYVIDIDGKVINQATGEELRGLGRLAPTLDQTRRGGGMHPPTR